MVSRVDGNQTAESQTGESRDSESQATRINCEERIHYPLYDPSNPHHNPRAPKYGRRRSNVMDADTPHPETQSTRRTLRRAGSTIAAFAHTLRSKGGFRRSPIPVEEEHFDPISDRSGQDQANGDPKQQEQSHSASPELDNSDCYPEDTASMIVNLGSSTRQPASRQPSGGCRRAGTGRTTDTFARSRYFNSPRPDNTANITRDEEI